MEHFGDDIRTVRVGDNVGDTTERPVYVAEGSSAWSPTHFALRSNATLDVDTFVVILELCLRAEDHKQELFIRTVGECLRVSADMKQLVLVHQVDYRT